MMMVKNPWFVLFLTSSTLQLNCSAAKIKSYGESGDSLWAQERQKRSLLDTGGKVVDITHY